MSDCYKSPESESTTPTTPPHPHHTRVVWCGVVQMSDHTTPVWCGWGGQGGVVWCGFSVVLETTCFKVFSLFYVQRKYTHHKNFFKFLEKL